ncbi:MAG: DNA-processing protein DprA [Salinisphaera sp.]|nr:DNA-processing protein DprA [Salinisphaera sp.]
MTGAGNSLDDWLVLARCPGLGARICQRLLARCGDAQGIRRASASLWREAGLREAGTTWLRSPDADLLAKDRAWLASPGCGLITWHDPGYPSSLRELPDAPAWLFARGDADLLDAPGCAIVGSRNPSRAGVGHARRLAHDLAKSGLVIVSGLADGIDAAAHQGALDADGMTVAVCGTGLDQVYPKRNLDLARAIGERGLLVSEFAPGMPPKPGHFPRRNRLIAGLTLGSVIVEAAGRSGSLITARLAMEYGREVFAMPGSVDNPLARGCHRLLRDGARLVETAADVLEELAPLLPGRAALDRQASEPVVDREVADPEQQALLACLGHSPARVDELVERSGLTADAVSSMLLILELQDLVTPLPGGAFLRKP